MEVDTCFRFFLFSIYMVTLYFNTIFRLFRIFCYHNCSYSLHQLNCNLEYHHFYMIEFYFRIIRNSFKLTNPRTLQNAVNNNHVTSSKISDSANEIQQKPQSSTINTPFQHSPFGVHLDGFGLYQDRYSKLCYLEIIYRCWWLRNYLYLLVKMVKRSDL
jgi:hypothetical protein